MRRQGEISGRDCLGDVEGGNLYRCAVNPVPLLRCMSPQMTIAEDLASIERRQPGHWSFASGSFSVGACLA
jgi:hypothetical protein